MAQDIFDEVATAPKDVFDELPDPVDFTKSLAKPGQLDAQGNKPYAGPLSAGPFSAYQPENMQEAVDLYKSLPESFLPESKSKGLLPATYNTLIRPIASPLGLLAGEGIAASAPLWVAAGVGFGALGVKSGLEKMGSDDPQTQLEGRLLLASAPLLGFGALASGKHPELAKASTEATEARPPTINANQVQSPSRVPVEQQSLPVERPPEVQAQTGTPQRTSEGEQALPQPAEVPKKVVEPGPGKPTGPGAAPKEGEIPETGEGADIYGVAERVRLERAAAGQTPQLEPGEGVSAESAATYGRTLLQKDPTLADKAVAVFGKDKSVSFEGFASARAKAEAAFAAARKAEEEHGTDSDQYRAAAAEGAKWDKVTKEMQTEWHKLGQAQQGHTDLDTGSFTGLERAWKEATGKEFTPKQAKQAKQIADVVNKAQKDAKAALETTVKTIDEQASKSTEDVKRVWNHVKTNYLGKGITDFDDIVHGTASDLGMSVNDVRRTLAQPKGAKTITNEMYKAMADRRRVVQAAKFWLKDQETPGWLRFARSVPRIFFLDKIFGHGTVGMITHAGLNIFNPGAWKTYWPEFFRQFPLAYRKAYHEQAMQDLVRDPNYVTARRAGLVNEPERYADDYQNAVMKSFMSKFAGLVGGRGFDALKTFRQARFNQIWNSYTPEMRTPEMAKLIADSVNHATGVVKMPFREWTGWTFFAPKLEGSRWAWMVGDPAKAGKILGNWKDSSPAERAFAIRQVKEKAAIAGTYFALLEANQGLLSATGSKQQINFTNPRKGDFLSFKVAGHNVGIVSPMLGMVRLFANMIHDSVGKRGKLEKLTPRGPELAEDLGQYARGKLSPFAAQAYNFAAQSDYQGRPLPFSGDKAPAYLRKRGEGKYTWGEYVAQEAAPIPVEEALKEVWRGQGMNEDKMNTYLKALSIGVAAGGTGARVSRDYNVKQP